MTPSGREQTVHWAVLVKVLLAGPGEQPCPSGSCEATSEILHPSWGSPVQEGYRHTEASPKKATKADRGLANLTCEERLRELGLLILEKRWLRGDLLAFYNNLSGGDREDGARLWKCTASGVDAMDSRWNTGKID